MLWVGLGNLIGGAAVGAVHGHLGRAHTPGTPATTRGAGQSDDAVRPVAQA